ncbi:glycosyltransferase [Fulvimarina endophytica]|uniref:Glycosyltransferase n=1 Tax=Fulvimarina endophytica TaxID=2293836 RepID=A0A371WYV5_9HYPH|nr:glycosyltransferase family 4 protein [Fulvimarina endophytica]RFC62170.1 glycosyltransferase [Fulvimarina endophytica]
MNVLFVHQNAPAQFAHVALRLVAEGHRVVYLTQLLMKPLPGVDVRPYQRHRSPSPETHHYLTDLEFGVLNGQAVYEACRSLRAEGFDPDVIVGHCGWGETLFIKDVWPGTPVLSYFEFFYRYDGADVGFDRDAVVNADDPPRIRAKNAIPLLAFQTADWGVTPTLWQKSGFPAYMQERITVLHEGIDTARAAPDPDALLLAKGQRFNAGEEIITYVARNLEPYRGFHIFMRALPDVLRRRPNARVLIVGAEGVSYGTHHRSGRTWKQVMLDEVGAGLDLDRVHFLGHLPYEQYIGILKVSAVHVYLTFPFVLSWSCLEALSTGCLLLASDTQPVEEVITDGENGILCDFHDIEALTERLVDILANPDAYAALRRRARERCIESFDLETVSLPRYLRLIDEVRQGKTP